MKMTLKRRLFGTFITISILLIACLAYLFGIEADENKLQRAEKITTKNVKNLSEGQYVEVEYECIYNAFFSGGISYGTFGKILDYQLLKLYHRDEYLFVSAFVEENDYYYGKPYYFQTSHDAQNFVAGEKYSFFGKVHILDEKSKKDLENSISQVRAEGPRPMTPENTNLVYEIRFINMEKNADRITRWIAFSIVAAILWVYSFLKLYAEISAERGLKKKERMEREEAEAVARRARYGGTVEKEEEEKDWNGN